MALTGHPGAAPVISPAPVPAMLSAVTDQLARVTGQTGAAVRADPAELLTDLGVAAVEQFKEGSSDDDGNPDDGAGSGKSAGYRRSMKAYIIEHGPTGSSAWSTRTASFRFIGRGQACEPMWLWMMKSLSPKSLPRL